MVAYGFDAGGGTEARLAALEARIEELTAQCSWGRRLEETTVDVADLDTLYLILGAIGVFSMQAGFAMLEVGTCASDHTKEILLKNIMDIAVGTICWWIFGYGIGTGSDSFKEDGRNGVFGTSGFFYLGDRDTSYDGKLHNQASWFFMLSFATTRVPAASPGVHLPPRAEGDATDAAFAGRRRSCPGRSRSGARSRPTRRSRA